MAKSNITDLRAASGGGGTFIFNVTIDSDSNVHLNGITLNDIRDNLLAGKIVYCISGDNLLTLDNCAISGSTITQAVFCARGVYSKQSSPTTFYIILSTTASVGDGFCTYRYDVDSSKFDPVGKTSAMTKQVGLDSSGQLWTTP